MPRKKPRPRPRPVERDTLIPREFSLTISNAEIAEIVAQPRKLAVGDYPHSVSVLCRVFFETSVDHFNTSFREPLTVTVINKSGTHVQTKSLDAKVRDAIGAMIKEGVAKKDLSGTDKGINNKNNPLYIETLNLYVHSRFYSPTERELRVA